MNYPDETEEERPRRTLRDVKTRHPNYYRREKEEEDNQRAKQLAEEAKNQRAKKQKARRAAAVVVAAVIVAAAVILLTGAWDVGKPVDHFNTIPASSSLVQDTVDDPCAAWNALSIFEKLRGQGIEAAQRCCAAMTAKSTADGDPTAAAPENAEGKEPTHLHGGGCNAGDAIDKELKLHRTTNGTTLPSSRVNNDEDDVGNKALTLRRKSNTTKHFAETNTKNEENLPTFAGPWSAQSPPPATTAHSTTDRNIPTEVVGNSSNDLDVQFIETSVPTQADAKPSERRLTEGDKHDTCTAIMFDDYLKDGGDPNSFHNFQNYVASHQGQWWESKARMVTALDHLVALQANLKATEAPMPANNVANE